MIKPNGLLNPLLLPLYCRTQQIVSVHNLFATNSDHRLFAQVHKVADLKVGVRDDTGEVGEGRGAAARDKSQPPSYQQR